MELEVEQAMNAFDMAYRDIEECKKDITNYYEIMNSLKVHSSDECFDLASDLVGMSVEALKASLEEDNAASADGAAKAEQPAEGGAKKSFMQRAKDTVVRAWELLKKYAGIAYQWVLGIIGKIKNKYAEWKAKRQDKKADGEGAGAAATEAMSHPINNQNFFANEQEFNTILENLKKGAQFVWTTAKQPKTRDPELAKSLKSLMKLIVDDLRARYTGMVHAFSYSVNGRGEVVNAKTHEHGSKYCVLTKAEAIAIGKLENNEQLKANVEQILSNH
jgi:hypothetical protein